VHARVATAQDAVAALREAPSSELISALCVAIRTGKKSYTSQFIDLGGNELVFKVLANAVKEGTVEFDIFTFLSY